MDSQEYNYIDLVKTVSNDMQVPTRLAFDNYNGQEDRDSDMQIGYLHADMNLPHKIVVQDIDSPSGDLPSHNGRKDDRNSSLYPLLSRPSEFSASVTEYPKSLMLSQDDLDNNTTGNPKTSLVNFLFSNLRKVSKSVTQMFNSDLQHLHELPSPINEDLYRLPSNKVDLDVLRNLMRKMDLRCQRLEALEEARSNRDTAILLSLFGMFSMSFLSYLFGGRRR